MTDKELIQKHQGSTGGCSVWHHAKQVSTTYKQIKERGKEIIPALIEYITEAGEDGVSMHVLHLLEELIPVEEHPYHPKRIEGTQMAGWNVDECHKAWVEWGKHYKKDEDNSSSL